jgi:hypothetical protein
MLHTSADINPILDQHFLCLSLPFKVHFVYFLVHPLRMKQFLPKLFLRGKQFLLISILPFWAPPCGNNCLVVTLDHCMEMRARRSHCHHCRHLLAHVSFQDPSRCFVPVKCNCISCIQKHIFKTQLSFSNLLRNHYYFQKITNM